MYLIGELLTNAIALLVVEYIIPGFSFDSITATIVAAVVIGVTNTFIRPVLQVIALPISILTLGVFAFLINVSLLWMVATIVPGFYIDGFTTAAIASIALALTNAFLHKVAKRGDRD